MKTVDTGNNSSYVKGTTKDSDGTYLVLTSTISRNFKTLKGAERFAKKIGLVK